MLLHAVQRSLHRKLSAIILLQACLKSGKQLIAPVLQHQLQLAGHDQ